MTRFGYFLSSEEHGPGELVRQARLAEAAGFEALWLSDHFHPWNDEQGQSPFVWFHHSPATGTRSSPRCAPGTADRNPAEGTPEVVRD